MVTIPEDFAAKPTTPLISLVVKLEVGIVELVKPLLKDTLVILNCEDVSSVLAALVTLLVKLILFNAAAVSFVTSTLKLTVFFLIIH